MFKEQAEHYLRDKEAMMFFSPGKQYNWDEIKDILNDFANELEKNEPMMQKMILRSMKR